MDGGVNTWDVTSEAVDKLVAEVRHGERQRVRERVDGRRGNPGRSVLWSGEQRVGARGSRVAENPRGECQGVGGGVVLLRVISTLGVE